MMIFRIPSALLDLASAGYVVGFDQLKLDGVDASQGHKRGPSPIRLSIRSVHERWALFVR